MIAWDYDADLALFLSSAVGDEEFRLMWKAVSAKSTALAYRCIMHAPLKKLRVCPPEALAWSPFKELYQEQKERRAGDSRGKLMTRTSRLFKGGKRASHPHGSNCVDIDVFRVKPGKALPCQGGKNITVSFNEVFPTAVGVFGPMLLKRPRSTTPLLKEYGADCLAERWVKILDAGGKPSREQILVAAGDNVRFTAWPTVPLRRLEGIELS